MSKIIIIGGGLSGLSAGIYGLKSGYDVTILEKNNELGGLCTTWERDGVTIDGCIHWLTGCKKSNLVPIYEKMGLFDKCKLIHPPFFYKFYYENETIEISRSLSHFEDNLKKFASSDNDKKLIKQFIKLIKSMRDMPIHSGKPLDTMSTGETMKYIKNLVPYAMPWQKMLGISLKEFSDMFESVILKHFFVSFMPSYYSLTYFVGVIMMFVTGNADCVNVTSKEFAMQAKSKFLSLGGKIKINAEVKQLNIEDERIISVGDSRGNKYYADHFICCAPLKYFNDNILPAEYKNSEVDFVFNNGTTYPLISTVYVSMKLDKSYEGPIDIFSLIYDEKGVTVGRYHNETLHYRAYPFLPNEDGSTTVICLIDVHADDYDIFLKAKEDGTYDDKKNDLANQVLDIFVRQFPQTREYLSIVDVSTPLSFERHTHTHKGAYLSNLSTPTGIRKTFPYKDKNIANLYYGCQWVTEIGGIPCAISNGKFAIDEVNFQVKKDQKQMKKDKKARKKIFIADEKALKKKKELIEKEEKKQEELAKKNSKKKKKEKAKLKKKKAKLEKKEAKVAKKQIKISEQMKSVEC